jgi:hypothetical protein
LEFFVDFKGGKCFKVDHVQLKKNSQDSQSNNSTTHVAASAATNSKDNNNNINKEKDKNLKEKEKEKSELLELVGSNKHAFIVSLGKPFEYKNIARSDFVF